MDLGLGGKTALVAGASADVGRATAIALAREGARVILVGRRRAALEETAAMIGATGAAQVLAGDLRDADAARRLVAQACEAGGGRIDLLANTVGPFPPPEAGISPAYGSDESWSAAFEGLFMSAVRLTREVMPLMKAQGAGAMVHLGSNSARYYSPMTAQFAAMKAALVHVVKNWARDGAAHGVRVNAVLPGWIKGERIAERVAAAAASAGVDPAAAERDMARGHDNLYWSPRMGRPQDYAQAIVFLLSEAAGYINGALLPVDGGSPVW
jgi:3-oxoacyl-[acyl-carrier protein] reductase